MDLGVSGKPTLSAYCHCTLCQRLNGAAFIHTIHFPAESFTWTTQNDIETIADSYELPEKPWKKRYRCRTCGCCVTSRNSKKNSVSVWSAQLERDENGKILDLEQLKPTAHMFYGTRMLDVNDDLDKWEGYPESSARIG